MPQPANRINNIPEHVFVKINANIGKLHKQGIDVIRLDIGNPDLPPPESVIETLYKHALDPDNHGYSGYRGIPEYRQAVANFYQKQFSVTLDPDTEVLPLIGTKEGIVNLTFAYISEGDVALIPDIAYPTYAMGTILAGGGIHYISTNPDAFLKDLSVLPQEIRDKAKLLWANYPNNPTGMTATLEFYQSLLEYCKRHDILLVSDNPYMNITYDAVNAPSVLQIEGAKAHSVEFFSLSKTYNMAGWRVGAIVGNADAIKNLLKVKSNVDSGHFAPIYHSASFALKEIDIEWINERNEIYRMRRDKLMSAISSIGLTATAPDATLYIWAKIPDSYNNDDSRFVNRVLEEAHVSLAPGSAYGPGGKGYVRISVSTSDDKLDEAISRLLEWHSKKQE